MFGAMMLKQCKKCIKWKPRTEFHKHKGRKDGLTDICKSCNKKHSSKWYHENKEKALTACRNWAISNLDKVKEIQQNWRNNNPERNKELREKASHKYRENNIEKVRAVSRNWKKENAGKNLQINRNYRARKSGNGGKITSEEWAWLKEFYNFTCLKCGKKEPEISLTLDHIKPLKLGGKNIIENSQPLCNACNSSKGAREIDYRQERELI